MPGCAAQGATLICPAWKDPDHTQDYSTSEYVLDVRDDGHTVDGHTITPIHAEIHLPQSSNKDRKPRFISVPPPTVRPENTAWLFEYPLYANEAGLTVSLTNWGGNVIIPATYMNFSCLDPIRNRCILTFSVPFDGLEVIQDRMKLNFAIGGVPIGFTELYQLRTQIEPRLDITPADDGHLHGANFVFDKVRFGKNGPSANVECADQDRTDCMISPMPPITTPAFVYIFQPAGARPEIYRPVLISTVSSGGYWRYKTPDHKASSPPAAPVGPSGSATVITDTTIKSTTTFTGQKQQIGNASAFLTQ